MPRRSSTVQETVIGWPSIAIGGRVTAVTARSGAGPAVTGIAGEAVSLFV